jgi:hypothetical protein
MQTFIDFLNFRFFISPYVLVICYYIGALGVPIGSWLLALWIKRKLTRTKDRILLYILFIVFFICMEVMWRMMFEFIIAYLQMREALMELAGH